MTSTTSMRILVTGGGTGGHTYPALTTIRAIQARLAATGRQTDLLWVGVSHGLEARIAATEQISFRAVTTGKLRRSPNRRELAADLARIALGILQAIQAVPASAQTSSSRPAGMCQSRSASPRGCCAAHWRYTNKPGLNLAARADALPRRRRARESLLVRLTCACRSRCHRLPRLPTAELLPVTDVANGLMILLVQRADEPPRRSQMAPEQGKRGSCSATYGPPKVDRREPLAGGWFAPVLGGLQACRPC